ncbi:MAG: AAA family ATPase [Planctomycetes bacterium]|nr:AAA family ATPase [Planctomycetota bacterium]
MDLAGETETLRSANGDSIAPVDGTRSSDDLGQRLNREVLAPMKELFVGKDEVIDLLGICLVGGENLFILGPPGTAKSALVQELALRLEGRMFDYLLTRFTEPNELFGPFDIRRLREGELVTNTDGMLPLADFVFLDELLNANSAILNSLLMVLNERIFRRGRETFSLPTLMVVGASNSLPQDEALGALFDRFLLRVRCDNVPTERLSEVLSAGWNRELLGDSRSSQLHVDLVRNLQAQLHDVDLAPVQSHYVDLVRRLRMAGIKVSDRRAVKLQRMIAASALLCGRRETIPSDLWVLRHIWDTDEQQEVIAALVDGVIAAAGGTDQPGSHPRSGQSDAPNPEVLAAEMRRMSTRLDDPDLAADEKSRLRDELGLLAARCEWVSNAQQREYLQQQIQGLWPRVTG